jgi:translation elongation factor EF-G
MFGYIGQLRGMTSGRASYTMEFSHYDPGAAPGRRRDPEKTKAAALT